MDPLDKAVILEANAIAWRDDAQLYFGSRREWRLAKASALMKRAWDLIA